jgi:CheY-like chemotaxis protein/HPt (histidine-containing phosphotransfer) domain-containing protein
LEHGRNAIEGMVLNILLVDDNRVNQDLASLFLKRCGHGVTVAVNGLEALKILAVQDEFDLVFMDVQMPVMDGLTASNYIRMSEENLDFDSSSLPPGLPKKLVAQRYKKHIPIVAMTANAMSGDRKKCLDAGMDGYLIKPFKQDQILRIISSVIGKSSLVVAHDAELIQSQRKSQAVNNHDVRNIVCDHLENIYGLGVEEIDEFLQTSCISLSDNLDKALECDKQGDLAALGAVAHSLKGSFLNLGLNDLAGRAKEIELKCKQGEKNSYGKQLEELRENLLVMLTDCF